MFGYLTKTSTINLKEFIVESINCLGWESDLSTRPTRFCKYCLEVSMNTNQWERLSSKTVYLMILAHINTKWVSSQLLGCGRDKFGPLGRRHRHLDHLMFVYHWIITSLTCRSLKPSVGSLLSTVCNKVTEGWGEIFEELTKEGQSLWKEHTCLNVVASFELKPASVSSRTFPFWFGTWFIQTNDRNKIIKDFKILK